MDLDRESIKTRIEALRLEHRDLDVLIERVVTAGAADQLHLQRLKKRKLTLKDMIARLESQLLPDIIA